MPLNSTEFPRRLSSINFCIHPLEVARILFAPLRSRDINKKFQRHVSTIRHAKCGWEADKVEAPINRAAWCNSLRITRDFFSTELLTKVREAFKALKTQTTAF